MQKFAKLLSLIMVQTANIIQKYHCATTQIICHECLGFFFEIHE